MAREYVLDRSGLAFAAGLFEGEGCISTIRSKTRGPQIDMTLRMTDRDVVDRSAPAAASASRPSR